jgi:hypothetical protein
MDRYDWSTPLPRDAQQQRANLPIRVGPNGLFTRERLSTRMAAEIDDQTLKMMEQANSKLLETVAQREEELITLARCKQPKRQIKP